MKADLITRATMALVPRTEELALRRVAAWSYLEQYRATDSHKALFRFVAICGEGGTFDSDFPASPWHILDHERPMLQRQCIGCHQRQPASAFRIVDPKRRKGRDGHGWLCTRCQVEWEHKLYHAQRPAEPQARAQHTHECADCGGAFRSKYENQLYCSDTCRYRAQKARYRAGKRAA